MFDIAKLVHTPEALKAIDEGTWVPAGDDAPGVEFLVTGFTSPAAQALVKKKTVAWVMKNPNKALTTEDRAIINREVAAEEVLRGWRGLAAGGKEIPYTKELAAKWLTSREGEKGFIQLVFGAVGKLDADAQAFVDSAVKN